MIDKIRKISNISDHSASLAIGLILSLAILLIAYFPTTYYHTTTVGIDSYEYHRPIFGTHTQSQVMTPHGPVRGVGALLVNLRRADTMPDVSVTVTNEQTDQELATLTIPGSSIVDDQFEQVAIPTPLDLPRRTPLRFTFAAPEATAENAFGIRFHPEVNPTSPGQALSNNQTTTGQLSLRLTEQVPLWKFLTLAATNDPDQFQKLLTVITAALGLGVLAVNPGWQKLPPATQRRVEIGILVTIALLGFGLRLAVLPRLHGVSGGDPYNYLSITKQIVEGTNPFANVKRLPGLPLLLIPTFVTAFDDQLWMRLIAIVSATISLVLIGIIARQLRLPWAAQLLVVAALAVQKDFFWISLRPEPYTLYTCLLLLSVSLFFIPKPKPYQQVILGLTLGYAAMTRQEGFVLALLIGLASLVRWKQWWWRGYLRIFLPAFLLVLPFFIHNTVTFGNPIFTPYFRGERLQIVDSWEAFKDSARATWGILDALWRPVWDQLVRISFTEPYLIYGVLFAFAWWTLWRTGLSNRNRVISLGIIGGSVAAATYLLSTYTLFPIIFSELVTSATAGILLVSPFLFLASTGWRGAFLGILAFSQVLIALWFHPFPKHYQQSYPLLLLFFVTALVPITSRINSQLSITSYWRRIAQVGYIAHLFIPLGLVTMSLLGSLNAHIDQENQDTAFDSVLYRAIRVAETSSGQVGFDQAYFPARLYFDDDAAYFGGEKKPDPAVRDQWVAENNIDILVVTNANDLFLPPPPDWKELANFRSEGKDEFIFESFVFSIPR